MVSQFLVLQGGGIFDRGSGGQSSRLMLSVVGSSLLEKRSVHGEAQHGEHCGADAGPQPEGGVLQVCLSHVPVTRGREREKEGFGEAKTERDTKPPQFLFVKPRRG